MKKLNFKWLVVLCIAIGFVNVAKAQIYSSEDCFYAEAGKSDVRYVVKFEYSKDRAWLKSVSHSTVRSNLAKSKDFYENEIWTDGQNSVVLYEYDSYKSTSSREVYKRTRLGGDIGKDDCPYCRTVRHLGAGWSCGGHGKSISGYDYVAFSKDKSSFITWYEKKDNYDGDTGNKKYYSRIPKEDLLPKAANYDFLND